MSEIALDLEKKRLLRLKGLHDALTTGENAEVVKVVMSPILDGMKSDLIDKLCNLSIEAQTLSEMACELRVLTRIQRELNNAIENGNRAKEAIETSEKQTVEAKQRRSPKAFQF